MILFAFIVYYGKEKFASSYFNFHDVALCVISDI